ncbi:GLUG motif-containing protein [Thalassolituus sp.]|uniref:GLUG motif-containing protein n=1 Tax=Thalassolituus sp. TaxID=2030822 RepID=UPI002A80B9D2|nr:GLUG motif-containing protein [Thalassolituus sp.]
MGGLAGYLYSSAINSSYVTGAVTGSSYVGGLAGRNYSNSAINKSFASGAVTGNSSVGGLTGYSSSSVITHSYWAVDTTGISSTLLSAATLAELQCPAGADNTSCASGKTLYAEWDSGVWDFGTNTQLPGLILSGTTYRDSDGDGSLDGDDVYPNNRAASWDSDNDGYADAWTIGCDATCIANSGLTLDHFPATEAAWQDTDLDGYPDAWATGCDATCIANSGLTLDQFPTTAAAWQDTDLDGYPDVWAEGCDAACTENSGLIQDQFPTIAGAGPDTDLDGYPDVWATGCDANCQAATGLTLDSYPDDIDNDGINNSDDTDDNNDGITDADADSDGLIDISSLEQLNAIRYNLAGKGRTLVDGGDSDSSGCPATVIDGVMQLVCTGYELTTNLDFDTNVDGVMDENDEYWNDGDGWMPIGSSSRPFTSTFDGNGHQIRNLFINRTGSYFVGLFGYISGESALLRNIGLTGELMQVQGSNYVGGLVGYAENAAIIEQSYVTGAVNGDDNVGGLAGRLWSNSVINNSFASGAVSGSSPVGGLAGSLYSSAINKSFASGAVTGNSYVGGLTGYSSSSVITNSYWAIDTTGISSTSLSAATLAELQCPAGADNTSCVADQTLYTEWDSGVWDFGTNTQLPGLILSGTTYRDSDGDGSLDGDDVYPNNRAASWDGDNDGYADAWTIGCDATCIANSGLTLDQFPTTAAAWQDTDLDGYPDVWAIGCDVNCQAATGLTLDSYLNDTDNDGINNSDDTDDNNDGITDADADSDGLIDISSLEQLNAIRYNLAGTGRTLVDGGDSDSSGCPVAVVNGVHQFQCMGYELINNLDFDTNADGVMDANDAYWNEGYGWEPLGFYNFPFGGLFDGNGHEIRNLYVNRPYEDEIGLFGAISGEAVIVSNLGLVGKLSNVLGADGVGLLAGFVGVSAEVSNSYSKGVVTGSYFVGGLVGLLTEKASINRSFALGDVSGESGIGGLVGATDEFGSISDAFATGAVSGSYNVGGLVGELGESALNNSFATGSVTVAGSDVGGLVGDAYGDTTITNSHWAVDTTGQEFSEEALEADNYFGTTLAELQCPTSSDNKDDCVISNTLYAGWDSSIWDFGTSTQLPGLIINGIVYRDEDGNGSLDENQAPTVTLTLKQDGFVVSDITAGDGDVTLEATVTDPDASDRHTLSWTYEGITVTSETDTGVTFNSDNLVAGEYTVSVVATDNRYSPLSAEAEITFTVYSAYVPEPEPEVEPNPNPEVEPTPNPAPGNTPTSSSKKGGGGALGLIWLMLCGGLVYTRQRRVVFAG